MTLIVDALFYFCAGAGVAFVIVDLLTYRRRRRQWAEEDAAIQRALRLPDEIMTVDPTSLRAALGQQPRRRDRVDDTNDDAGTRRRG